MLMITLLLILPPVILIPLSMEEFDIGCKKPEYNWMFAYFTFDGYPVRFDMKYPTGVNITYHCRYGYNIHPPEAKNKTCNNGTWIGQEPTCVACYLPDMPQDGFYNLTETPGGPNAKYMFGDKLNYYCNEGFSLIGFPTRKCDVDGEWYPLEGPYCILSNTTLGKKEMLVHCPPAPKVPNAVKTLIRGSNRSEDKYAIDCDLEYRDVRTPCVTSYITCVNGSWKGSLPRCEKVKWCMQPPYIENGYIIPRGNFGSISNGIANYHISIYGDRYRYKVVCKEGYRLPGPNVTYRDTVYYWCNRNGCWSPDTVINCYGNTNTRVQDNIIHALQPDKEENTTSVIKKNKEDKRKPKTVTVWHDEKPVRDALVLTLMGIASLFAMCTCFMLVAKICQTGYNNMTQFDNGLVVNTHGTTYTRSRTTRRVIRNGIRTGQQLPTYEEVVRASEVHPSQRGSSPTNLPITTNRDIVRDPNRPIRDRTNGASHMQTNRANPIRTNRANANPNTRRPSRLHRIRNLLSNNRNQQPLEADGLQLCIVRRGISGLTGQGRLIPRVQRASSNDNGSHPQLGGSNS